MSSVAPSISRFELMPWPFDDQPELDPPRQPDLGPRGQREDPNCRHIVDIIPLWSGHEQVIWVPCRAQDSVDDPVESSPGDTLRHLSSRRR